MHTATSGVLLAAGRSSRMGTNKAVLPWGLRDETTVVAAAFDLLRQDFLAAPIHVTLGHDAETVALGLGNRPFQPIHVDPDAPMFESIRAAVRALEHADYRSVWLHPVDVPFIQHTTAASLRRKSLDHPRSVILPQYNDRGGHPVFIPFHLFPRIIRWPGEGGLRTFWLEVADDVIRVPVDDPFVVMDLDTPEQYERARQLLRDYAR